MEYEKMFEIEEQLLKNLGWTYVNGSKGTTTPSLVHTNGDIAHGIPAEMVIKKMYDDFKNGESVGDIYGSKAGTMLKHRSQMETWEELGLLNNIQELKPTLSPIDGKKKRNFMEERLSKEELIYQLNLRLNELEAEEGSTPLEKNVRAKAYENMINELKGTKTDWGVVIKKANGNDNSQKRSDNSEKK